MELFQIGEMARLFHLSVSSICHYETLGLVTPERIDPDTGYRYYSVRQFEAFNTIRYLRTLDMPLPEKIETLRLPLGSETAELSVVRLPGISHIIVPAQVLTRARAEELIRRWAEVLHADALGILLLQEEELCFDPLVCVTQTDTAVWERGCGSGSAAIGAYLTKKHGAPQCVSIRQPGGAIAVTTRCAEDGALSSLTISGTVLLGRSKKADVTL